ncbi:uncharacterized protein [Pseudorasbora parva]|uniref:uncharacterized protein n=1 Tax=Pseudorasbora parva TaxID=51549 RepID=UPI00351F0811
MSKTWVLVEWREEPPTYDIVPKKDILKKKFEPGDVVDVAYEDESSPATIIDIDESKENLRRKMFRLEGKRNKQSCLPNAEKRVAKKKKMYTPTQSPSSDAEPPCKHQFVHRKDNMLMQEINSMDSQAREHSSRETQLEKEILKLQKENENLRALNVSLQQKILPMIESMNWDTLNHQKTDHSSQKNPPEKTQGLGLSPSVLASCGRGGTSCTSMVKDLAVAVAVFGRETLATHGLSGRTGNANKGTIAKPALDQDKVVLILDTVQKKFPDVPIKFIRAASTQRKIK